MQIQKTELYKKRLKTNITYIISNINKALAFEWITASLNKNKFNLNFILLNPGDSELEKYLKQNNILVNRIRYSGKKDIPGAILKTYKILKQNNTHIVHTHLFDANIIGLTAAKLAGIPKRIHTRHHSDFHHMYHPKAVKYDRFVNLLSTHIIAISNVVKNILINKEKVPEQKINLIHHGFKFDDFINVSPDVVENLRKKHNVNFSKPVIGVISRYTEWKGIQFIIPAFSKLLETYPDALLLLANANGDFKNEIKTSLKLIPDKNYIEIPFESDIFSLYQLFDVFVHVPISSESEAFGQTYIESLAAGIPSVFTLSGIANEFIKDGDNALVVPYQDSDSITAAIAELLKNQLLTKKIVLNGKKEVYEKFQLGKMILSLEQLYER